MDLGTVRGAGSLHIHIGVGVDDGKVLDRDVPALGETGHDLDGIPPYGRNACYDMEALHSLRRPDEVAEVAPTAEDPLLGINGHALGNEVAGDIGIQSIIVHRGLGLAVEEIVLHKGELGMLEANVKTERILF